MNLKLLLSIAVALAVAPPLHAEEIKFKHALSLYTDDKGAGMKQPEGVACDAASRVLVADTGNDRLLRYTFLEGNVKTVDEIVAPDIASPVRVNLSSQGDLFILGARQHRILRLAPHGEVKGFLILSGIPSPAAVIIRSFAIGPNDELYLLDVSSGRVLIVDPEGRFQREVSFPEDYGFFSDIAVDKRATIYLVDSANAAVYTASKEAIFTPLVRDLREKIQMAFPVAIAVDARERIYITDRNNGNLVVLGRDGSFLARQLGRGWVEGLLRYPTQICINDNGEAFVADWGNSRVQKFVPVK